MQIKHVLLVKEPENAIHVVVPVDASFAKELENFLCMENCLIRVVVIAPEENVLIAFMMAQENAVTVMEMV
ncbi:MAG: hypothetical protein IJ257_06750 [Treponema sp.]|nr:hypothetical protein [Treponema sp.]